MFERKVKLINSISNFGHVLGCVVLYLIAIGIILSAIVSIIMDLSSSNFTIYQLLDEVGLLVFAIAVIDVAKYLMIEEVLKQREDSDPREARKTLTKFAVIISTALALEGLVLTIEVAKSNVTEILFPMSLLLVSILFIVGISIYQKFNATADRLDGR